MFALTFKGLLKHLGVSGKCVVIRPSITLLYPLPDAISRTRPLFDRYAERSYGDWRHDDSLDVVIALEVLREENAARDVARIGEALVDDGWLLARAAGDWLMPSLRAAGFHVERSWRGILVARKKAV
jgi:hypothetical protein